MDFARAIAILNRLITREDPASFNVSWIIARAPAVYRFICREVRTENNDIDWDAVTHALDKKFQSRWVGRRRASRKPYRNRREVDAILKQHEPRLSVFISINTLENKLLRDRLTVALVRLAQQGNTVAREQVIMLVRCTVDGWVAKYAVLSCWGSYDIEIDKQIDGCVTRYRYTGSFFNYVFKTLYFSGRYLRHTYFRSMLRCSIIRERLLPTPSCRTPRLAKCGCTIARTTPTPRISRPVFPASVPRVSV